MDGDALPSHRSSKEVSSFREKIEDIRKSLGLADDQPVFPF
jgi:hypothetical protein